jgi:hypothetical protein
VRKPEQLEAKRARNRAWKKANPHFVRGQERRYAKRYPHKEHQRRRCAQYGIDQTEYKRMLVYQHHACAICLEHLMQPCIDHDHETGQVRALLCSNCNTALGMMHENTWIMQQAIDYIALHKMRSAA